MKMRFKIGDVVFVKTRTEICNIMDSNDSIGDCHFANDMFNHCGSTLTIDQIDDIQGLYRMKEDPWHLYNDDMISHLYEDKDNPRFAVGDKVILDPWPCEVINVRYIKEKSRFLYTVKGIDFTKLVSADMLEIDASEYPKYNEGDVVGVYGYETDVVIADVRKEGSSFTYKVYLADDEEWIYDSDIAYRGDVAKAVSSMKSNIPEVKREPLFKPDDKVETNDNLFGTVDRSWWDEKENCYVYEVSFAHVDFGIYKEKHLKPYVKKTQNTNIVTPADMGNIAERYVMYDREKFMEDIIESLDDWVFNTFSESEHDGDYDYGQPYIECRWDTMEDLLNDLHNNMFNNN